MNKILPVVMDTSFNRLAVINDYSSFIWTSRFYNTGDFQLITDVNPKNISLFKKDYYIERDDDENTGIIEDIIIQRNEEGKDQLIVKGRFLQSILSRRIVGTVASERSFEDETVTDVIDSLITKNIINPTSTNRKISNFVSNYTAFESDTISGFFMGENLMTIVSKLCEEHGIGFKVTLYNGNKFRFQLYEGVDRTYDQNDRPWVVFSNKYNNMLSSEYEENYQKRISAVWIRGQDTEIGEEDSLWVAIGEESTGIIRREFYKDAKSIDRRDFNTFTYRKFLQQAGYEAFTNYSVAFQGVVYFGDNVYRQEINLGDLCVIENSDWGISVNSRLVEVIESVNEVGEYSITPTVGI